jgi:DNA repair protein RadA/Sms
MAIGSAAKGMQLKANAAVFGEVGLSGEIRHVPFIEKRVAEAQKMGFNVTVGPSPRTGKKPATLQGVRDVRTALNEFLSKD